MVGTCSTHEDMSNMYKVSVKKKGREETICETVA
jgi:hypothetical protein